jgi:hypothetical protein
VRGAKFEISVQNNQKYVKILEIKFFGSKLKKFGIILTKLKIFQNMQNKARLCTLHDFWVNQHRVHKRRQQDKPENALAKASLIKDH